MLNEYATPMRFMMQFSSWPLGLLLHDNRTIRDMTALDHIVDAQRDQITPTQLAVDGEVEQRELPGSMIQLQPNPDSPDLLFQLRTSR